MDAIWQLCSRSHFHDGDGGDGGDGGGGGGDSGVDDESTGLQPRERGVGLRDVPRGRRGDAILHWDRLRYVQDRHQYTGHPLNEGSSHSTLTKFIEVSFL